MKKLTALTLTISALLYSSQSIAGTYWYQPTPYPTKKSDGTLMPQDLEKVHIHDGWVNNNYPSIMSFQLDDKLKLGGWGDIYRSYINFDLVGLPADPTLVNFYLYNYQTPGNTTAFQYCIPSSAWNTSVTWSTQPTLLGCTGIFNPIVNNWFGANITSWYQNWKSEAWGKFGIMLNPETTNNNNSLHFRSSRYADYASDPYADGKRPILQFDFTPTFEMKMPVPNGYSWQLTNEVGGYECKGAAPWPDIAHQVNNYFSIDMTWKNIANPGYAASQYGSGNTPIISVAWGVVAEVGYNSGNGNYIVIDHDGDGVMTTGFQTRYLHLVSLPKRKNGTLLSKGNTLQQGDQVGVMGTTGASTGTHLHFGVRYQNNGNPTSTEMTKVVMEGRMLKSYQTECSINSNGVPIDWVRYYPSTNVPTGN